MFFLHDFSRILTVEPLFSDESVQPSGFCIDSRKIEANHVFVALKTPQNDGHAYLSSAFDQGAAGALISRDFFQQQNASFFTKKMKNIWVVPDPYLALVALAIARRKESSAVFIGVTGSVGKTSTKEFLGYFLKKLVGDSKVLMNPGNFNNHLGLPLTLLKLEKEHRICLCELGANHPGEIKTLCEILSPDHGILTCVSDCHLEGFGTTQNIYETKFDLIRSLPEKGVGIIPSSDLKLVEMAKSIKSKILKIGIDENADNRLSNVEVKDDSVHFCFSGKYHFSFPGCAEFYAVNAAMALSMVEALGYSLDDLNSDWDDFVLPDGRFSKDIYKGSIQIIFDGYNASPLSFRKGIESINTLKIKGKKILIFSDMLELGEKSDQYHAQLGQQIEKSDFKVVVAYGKQASIAIDNINDSQKKIKFVENQEEAAVFLKELIEEGDLLYFKASRGMRVEKVRDALALDKMLNLQQR